MSGLTRLIHEMHRRSLWQVLWIYLVFSTAPLAAQTPRIGSIDLYGLRTISEDAVRSVLSIDVGDPQPSESERAEIELRRRAEREGERQAHTMWKGIAPDVRFAELALESTGEA